MTEHVFPRVRRRRDRDLLDLVVLHRLLTGHPRRIGAERLARELAGRAPTDREVHAVRHALRRLTRDGLANQTAATVGASRAARRFHELMLGINGPIETTHQEPDNG